ncbi:hypothetical protein AMATHDRAFT_189316 [Amanita thiersii Skay4041]|uniref:Uncharacterized protein n=1 Tax=Amanita thiersii Skay4041 TaxID=703135 RepID=A0A2A9NPZ7_9AGAR|nr:hypothetical protein AMATHDRAFT_189316 [Amanita thiersii Skay4041]
MIPTLIRSTSASSLSRSLRHLLPEKLPPSLAGKPGNLYQVLSRTPDGGVGKEVYQMRWNNKQIEDSYWKVTRSRFKCQGMHGKVWGLLYWKGKLVSPHEEVIRGGLKYTWAEGRSRLLAPSTRPGQLAS